MHNKAGYLKSEATLCCQIVTKLIQKQVPLGCVEEQATDTHDNHSVSWYEIRLKRTDTHHGIWISNEISEGVQEALVLHHLGIDVMKFSHTNGCRLPHIRVLVLQALPQWLTQVLCDLVHADAAHGPNGQSPDQRVGVLTVLEANKIELNNLSLQLWWRLKIEIFIFLVCGNPV